MNDGPFEIQYEATDAQASRAARAVLWRRHISPGLIFVGVWLAGAVILSLSRDSGVTVPAVLYALAAYQLLLTWSTCRRYMQTIERLRAKARSNSTRAVFSYAGVYMETEVATVSYKWCLFTGLWRCKDILLLVGDFGYFAIPRATVAPELSDFIARCLRSGRGGWPLCRQCGYDLRGQTEPRCPECGTPFDVDLLNVKR
jgi:hypothetical protein